MSDSEADRRPLVNLRVNIRQKARWEKHANDERNDEYTSLSHLIRIAVEKELSEDSEASPVEGKMVDEVRSELNSLSENIEQLQKDVSWIRSREEHNIEEFAHTLFSNLKSISTDNPESVAAQIGVTAGLEPQTTTALADRLDTTPRRVGEAIEFLREQHMPLIKFEVDGDTHWFKEE